MATIGTWNMSTAATSRITISTAVPVRGPAIQAKVANDPKAVPQYTCSSCRIIYEVPSGKPICPLCEEKRVTQKVRDALFEVTNANNMLQNEFTRLSSQVDTITAMRVAMDTVSDNDMAFLKSVLYRWQEDRTRVAIKPTHGLPKGRGSKRRAQVDGFVALFRDSEAEVHTCDSVGGLAIAGYMDEAIALVGQVKAIEFLARAVTQYMPATS